jgi:hypothetical protein
VTGTIIANVSGNIVSISGILAVISGGTIPVSIVSGQSYITSGGTSWRNDQFAWPTYYAQAVTTSSAITYRLIGIQNTGVAIVAEVFRFCDNINASGAAWGNGGYHFQWHSGQISGVACSTGPNRMDPEDPASSMGALMLVTANAAGISYDSHYFFLRSGSEGSWQDDFFLEKRWGDKPGTKGLIVRSGYSWTAWWAGPVATAGQHVTYVYWREMASGQYNPF